MPVREQTVHPDRIAPMLVPDIVREEADRAGVHLTDQEVTEIANHCASGFRPDITSLVQTRAERKFNALFA